MIDSVPSHMINSLKNNFESNSLLRCAYDIASSYKLVHTKFMNIKQMLSSNRHPNNFLDCRIQQFLNRKHNVTQQCDSPAEPSPSPKYIISLQLPYLGSVSLATYSRTQQFYKTQGCSKHEAAFFFKILKSFKAGSRSRTSKLYSTIIMLFTRLRAHAVPPTLRKRNLINCM